MSSVRTGSYIETKWEFDYLTRYRATQWREPWRLSTFKYTHARARTHTLLEKLKYPIRCIENECLPQMYLLGTDTASDSFNLKGKMMSTLWGRTATSYQEAMTPVGLTEEDQMAVATDKDETWRCTLHSAHIFVAWRNGILHATQSCSLGGHG